MLYVFEASCLPLLTAFHTARFSKIQFHLRTGGVLTSTAVIRFPVLPLSNATHEDSAQSQSTVDETDETVMARICEGDEQALAALFRRYARIVRGVAFKVLQDISEADDLLQDIFLLIHRDCGKFDASKGSARFWILQITYRRAISRRRHLTSRHFYTHGELEPIAEKLPDPIAGVQPFERSLEAALGKATAHKAFEALSENQRFTLRLFFFEGYTLDEIAAKLGQSRAIVKQHYFRGLNRLRRHIFGRNGNCQRVVNCISGTSLATDCQPIPGNRR